MKNNDDKTIINCHIRPFDCMYSNPILTVNMDFENFCSLRETDFEHASINIKEERKEKLNKIKNEKNRD